MTTTYKRVDERRQSMLDYAIDYAEKHHYALITRDMLAKYEGVVPGRVTAIFGTMNDFYNELERYANKLSCMIVCSQFANKPPR
jgi:hypothetical protein